MSFEELEGCELGTQEYWDKQYKSEVSNFRNHKDVGDVWFGEDIAERIVRWMDKNIPKTDSIIDIGCGNGMLLVELSTSGFTELTGMDYSEDAIVLAKEVAAHYDVNVKFIVKDILKGELEPKTFDVVLDKGTYDAVSLTSEAKNNRQSYINNVRNCLKDGGLLVITSCNWTNDELVVQFEGAFSKVQDIPTPQFQFGGKVGSVVSSVIFKKT